MAWIDSTEVAEALGTVSASDTDFLDRCTAAANAFAYRRREQAGYTDDPDVSPGPDASMGTTMYAVALFRERGSVDSFASFEDFSTGVFPQSSFGQVLRLLGVPRPAVDRLWTAEELALRPTPYRGIRR
jgi:hypothetical protein